MPDTHAPQQLEPWQWSEEHWRKLVKQVRAGQRYRPKAVAGRRALRRGAVLRFRS